MDNKQMIRNFYQEFFNDHMIESAVKYVREDYIQHNSDVEQGRKGLMEAFKGKFETMPDFALNIEMMIEENNMVSVYLKNIGPDGTTRARVVDIYRIEDNMLAEHWDVLQFYKI